MITDSRLKYCVSFSGLDFYEYEVRLGRYFFIPMAYYEKLWTRKVRETMDYIRGNYHVYYIAKGNELIGYGTIVRGGGRYKFSTENDIILCNLWIQPCFRGNGYANVLVKGLSEKLGVKYKNAYEFITHNNLPSIKVALANGFKKVANASRRGYLNYIEVDSKGPLGIYKKSGNL